MTIACHDLNSSPGGSPVGGSLEGDGPEGDDPEGGGREVSGPEGAAWPERRLTGREYPGKTRISQNLDCRLLEHFCKFEMKGVIKKS